ncbi:MAG: hypothetical protein JWM34_4803 [Ilumatobacteraceae bacterium]|nr:hypothetical protein [Ilumatobacteraceae bacterium]
MSVAIPILLVLAGIGAVCALTMVPFVVLSWPQRVRWIVSSQSMSYVVGGPLPPLPIDVREVVVEAVAIDRNQIDIVIADTARDGHDPTTYATDCPSRDVVALLRDWTALRTPLLLFVDESGATLHGPTTSIGRLGRIASGGLVDSSSG